MNTGQPSIAIQHRDQILQRLANGEFITHIAKSLGLERSSISQRLRNDPEYLQAREAGYETQLDQALEAIASAGDNVNIARAREVYARRLEWRAEREFSARWGARTYATVEHVEPTAAATLSAAADLLRELERREDRARTVATVRQKPE